MERQEIEKMIRYMYDPPGLVKRLFNIFIWSTRNNKVLLTFDDGPIPDTTETIIRELGRHNFKALFMCVGDNIRKYPELTNMLIEEGHSIGNHTFHHKRITQLNKNELALELTGVNQLLMDRFGYQVKYFRPPYGRFNFSTKHELDKQDLTAILWSLLTFDYKNNINIVKFAVQNYLNMNSIIVLHDSIKSKDIIVDSIRFIVEEVNRKGYEIGAPEECLR